MEIEPVKRIDKIMFSHGHEDHTGGLVDLLKLRNLPDKPVQIIAHPDVWAPKYWRSADRTRFDYIGIPYARAGLLESLGARISTCLNDPVWITDQDHVTSGEVPMRNRL